MSLVEKFKKLVSHLHAEGNDMADEFLAELYQLEGAEENEWQDWTPTKSSTAPFDGYVDYILRDDHKSTGNSNKLVWSLIPDYACCEIVKWRKA